MIGKKRHVRMIGKKRHVRRRHGKRSHGRRRHGKRKDDGRRLRSPSKRKRSKAGGHNGGTRDVEVAAGLPHEVEKKSPASPSLLGPPFGVRREKHGDVDVGGVVHYGCVMEEPSPLLGKLSV